jgi:hypothetical protein
LPSADVGSGAPPAEIDQYVLSRFPCFLVKYTLQGFGSDQWWKEGALLFLLVVMI